MPYATTAADALLLFLSGAEYGGVASRAPARCPPSCKGKPRRPDCVCCLVPPLGSHRKKGLWVKDPDALLGHLGSDPAQLARSDPTRPAGLKNLGSTCYVNAVLQCLFAVPTFRRRMYDLHVDARGAGMKRGGAGGGAVGGGDGGRSGGDARGVTVGADSGGDAGGGAVGADSGGEAGGGTVGAYSGDGPVEILRQLFALLQRGRRRTADPAAFARSLALETGTQQDGQEFLKLLLAYVERAGRASPNPEDRTFVADHFRGVSTYATTCQRCHRASEASEKPVDFYELELNVGATVGGVYVGPAGAGVGGAGGGGSLLESLHEYLATEHLEGDNQYRCERCDAKVDATRAVRLHELPRYVNFQLKRFVFDFETLSRRKVTDDFSFPLEVNLGPFVTPLAGPGHSDAVDGSVAGVYDLTLILVHRGQNATSGHYVALVRDAGGVRGQQDNWWRFDDDEVVELRGGPFGEAIREVSDAEADKGKGEDKDQVQVKVMDDEEVRADDEEKERNEAKPPVERPAKAARRTAATPSKPKKGRDGSTLGDNEFTSPDAYLLVYRRRDDEADRSDCAEPSLPADLAATVKADDVELQAMIDTYAARVEEERQRIRRRREVARAVAGVASVVAPVCDAADMTDLGGGSAPVHSETDVRDGPLPMDLTGDGDLEIDLTGGDDLTAGGKTVDGHGDEYYWVPGEWLTAFCDSPAPPPPIDTCPLLCACASPLADPAKASRAKRVSAAAWRTLVAAAGMKEGAPVLRGAESVCATCLRTAARGKAGVDAAEAARATARDDIRAWDRAAAGDPSANGTADRGVGYRVSKQWLQRWTAWKTGDPPPSVLVHPTAAITCKHGGLLPGAKCAVVPGPVWDHLQTTTVSYDIAPTERRDEADQEVLIVGETGGVVTTKGKGKGTGSGSARGSKPPPRSPPAKPEDAWSGPPVTFPVFSADGPETDPHCQACAAANAGDAAAAAARKRLAASHLDMCGALLTPTVVPPRSAYARLADGADGEDHGPYRLMPARWLKRWRAFVTGADRQARSTGEVFAPTRDSLAADAAALRCAHGLLEVSMPRLMSTEATDGGWIQASPVEDGDPPEVELVGSDDFEVLQLVMQGEVTEVPRARVTFEAEGPPKVASSLAVCVPCARRRTAAASAARESYVGVVIKVEKVTSPPPPPAPPPIPALEAPPNAGDTKPNADMDSRRTDDETCVAVAAETETTGGVRRSTRRAAAAAGPKEWWKAPAVKSGGSKPSGTSRGRATSFTVDATYTVWQLKLLILERMAVHPLDQSLYAFATGAELAGGDNAATLASAGVRPDARLALVARADHDADDLTGLEMPLGPVAWEDHEVIGTNPGGGGGGGGGGEKATRAPERGFAGTGLFGAGA